MESAVLKIFDDIIKLKQVAADHGIHIKDLVKSSTNAVTKMEMMAAMATTRFQQLNLSIKPNVDPLSQASHTGDQDADDNHIKGAFDDDNGGGSRAIRVLSKYFT